jgi:hypothetical protein
MGRVVSERGISEPTGTVGPDDEGPSRSRSVLEEEREFFLRSLRDLEAERAAGDIDEHDYAALRDDYTVRAAQVLRRLAFLDGRGPDPDRADYPGATDSPGRGPAPAAPGMAAPGRAPYGPAGAPDEAVTPARSRTGLKRVLTGVAVVLIVGGVAWAGLAVAGVRLPGEKGGLDAADQATQLVVNAETAEASNNPALAFKDYQGALAKDPDNTEALTGEGAILVEAGGSGGDRGLIVEGVAKLGQAETADPAYAPAYAYRGFGYYFEENFKAAVPQLETYIADTPADRRISSVASLLTKAKAKLAGAT